MKSWKREECILIVSMRQIRTTNVLIIASERLLKQKFEWLKTKEVILLPLFHLVVYLLVIVFPMRCSVRVENMAVCDLLHNFFENNSHFLTP